MVRSACGAALVASAVIVAMAILPGCSKNECISVTLQGIGTIPTCLDLSADGVAGAGPTGGFFLTGTNGCSLPLTISHGVNDGGEAPADGGAGEAPVTIAPGAPIHYRFDEGASSISGVVGTQTFGVTYDQESGTEFCGS